VSAHQLFRCHTEHGRLVGPWQEVQGRRAGLQRRAPHCGRQGTHCVQYLRGWCLHHLTPVQRICGTAQKAEGAIPLVRVPPSSGKEDKRDTRGSAWGRLLVGVCMCALVCTIAYLCAILCSTVPVSTAMCQLLTLLACRWCRRQEGSLESRREGLAAYLGTCERSCDPTVAPPPPPPPPFLFIGNGEGKERERTELKRRTRPPLRVVLPDVRFDPPAGVHPHTISHHTPLHTLADPRLANTWQRLIARRSTTSKSPSSSSRPAPSAPRTPRPAPSSGRPDLPLQPRPRRLPHSSPRPSWPRPTTLKPL